MNLNKPKQTLYINFNKNAKIIQKLLREYSTGTKEEKKCMKKKKKE